MDHLRLHRRRRRHLGEGLKDEDNRIRGFLVETDRPGFRAEDIHGKWSLRASVTSGLSLQDVHSPRIEPAAEDRTA